MQFLKFEFVDLILTRCQHFFDQIFERKKERNNVLENVRKNAII